MTKIFYSWQDDLPSKTCRSFIEEAVEQAIKELKRDVEIAEAIREQVQLDKDTRNVPGSPPIVDTILQKIEGAVAFIPDLTFVAIREDGKRRSPNPNVLIEYGWAMKSLTRSRIIPIMNTAYGSPSEVALPFDMQHVRYPIQYCLPDDATNEERQKVRTNLVKQLTHAIKLVLDMGEKVEFDDISLYEPLGAQSGKARFRESGQPLGWIDNGPEVRFTEGPAMWLRVVPVYRPARPLMATDIRSVIVGGKHWLTPLNCDHAGNVYAMRAADGIGLSTDIRADNTAFNVAFTFSSGEIWMIDASYVTDLPGVVCFSETEFHKSLVVAVNILEALGVAGPYRWEAGLDRINGMTLGPVGQSMSRRMQRFVAEFISKGGQLPKDVEVPANALDDFFEAVYDAVMMKRPKH